MDFAVRHRTGPVKEHTPADEDCDASFRRIGFTIPGGRGRARILGILLQSVSLVDLLCKSSTCLILLASAGGVCCFDYSCRISQYGL